MTEIVDLLDADHERVLELCNELNSEAAAGEFNGALRFVVCYGEKGPYIHADSDHAPYRITKLRTQRHQTIMPPVMPEDPERIDDEGGGQA